MNSRSQVNQALDNEHRATLELLGRVEQTFVRVPAPTGEDLARLAASLAAHIERDIGRHFDFEERELFPRLEEAGTGDLVELLMEEHRAIREVTGELLPLARAASTGPLDRGQAGALKRCALEMAERLRAHIDKETMALLPEIDSMLDEDTDRGLALGYAEA
ncbi:MAG TPA: hemerythrin domain-containing protein [Casimicrobiaceae bacterium]|nr:hemerythrin domain-containing protein [Casimicrobiaceae bacterium]